MSGAQTFKSVTQDGAIQYTNLPPNPGRARPVAAAAVAQAPEPRRASVAEGVESFLQYAREAASRYGVPEKLVTAVIRAESGFNPRAVSPKGARGLMQLMPDTASMLGVRDSFDPAQNIDGGVRHLRGLIDRFGNNLQLAVAAYNAGEQAVTQYRGIPPYPETQGYVQKVLTLFSGAGGDVAAVLVFPTYKFTEDDGTVIYTNVPPRAAARLIRR